MIEKPKGTKDVLPQDSYKWHKIEEDIRRLARVYQLQEIRTPCFEHTELFLRGVGDTTDIVNKEMYTFDDRGGRSITLKPEGTASVARCFVEYNLQQNCLPMRTYYITPVFRYERPQAGRLREHHQFGVEVYGSETAEADAEVISIARALFDGLGIHPTLYINSIGCPTCRARYHEALVEYFRGNEGDMCETCKTRLGTNPLRILDCKNDRCGKIAAGAPSILDYLCEDCQIHFDKLKHALEVRGIAYTVNPTIVRGLDYYTRTVFEFVCEKIGAKSTVCGGGRYNHLIESIGGKPCPAVGFGMGLERLLMTLEAVGVTIENRELPTVYIASMGQEDVCAALVQSLRNAGVAALGDIMQRGLKAQMKYADKIGARYTIVVGESEVAEQKVQVKDMREGKQFTLAFDEIVGFMQENA
ncbi:MAG: histidine--tRNA ligase [Clostridia bacterium]|nr:histidine--tRNA ligase [Clostridia bacterium]